MALSHHSGAAQNGLSFGTHGAPEFFISHTAMRLLLSRYSASEALEFVMVKFRSGKRALFSCDVA